MQTKKPKTIIFLIGFYIWGFFKLLGYIMNYQISADYIALNQLGLSYIFLIYAVISFLLSMPVIYYLFRPKLAGYYLLISSLFTSLMYTLATAVIFINNSEAFVNGYIISRQSRGFALSEDKIAILSSDLAYIPFIMGIAFYVLLVYLATRKKNYFYLPSNSIALSS